MYLTEYDLSYVAQSLNVSSFPFMSDRYRYLLAIKKGLSDLC